MKRRAITLLLVLALVLTLSTGALAAGSLSNFQKVNTFQNGQFWDVSSAHWAYSNVRSAYEYGLMKGESDTAFAPDSSLTVAATITMAARLHSVYYTGSENFVQGSPWYQVYVDYALQNGLITGEYANYDAAIQRWEFAQILGRALPDTALQAINTVEDGAIPDVSMSASFASDVYRLYRAGILTGSGEDGSFTPYSGILRSEAAAIVSRMVEPGLRKSFTLSAGGGALTAGEVFQKTSNSVFYIALYDASGQLFATGSGVFLSSSGVAVTNYHVIEGASSAVIKTASGQTYNVRGVYDYDEDLDLAVLQIDGSGFQAATIGDSRNLSTGDTVYALGNPLGLESTFSDGIISNPNRQADGQTYIQITAPISSGSSGGGLFNDRGELIGITTGGFSDGQNMNVAVHAYQLEGLRQSGTVTPLSELFGGTVTIPGTIQSYSGYPGVPDFGAYFGVPVFDSYYDAETNVTLFLYYMGDFPYSVADVDMDYYRLLKNQGFLYIGKDDFGGYTCDVYTDNNVTVMLITSVETNPYYMVGVVR